MLKINIQVKELRLRPFLPSFPKGDSDVVTLLIWLNLDGATV
jgi:hypothetical protein